LISALGLAAVLLAGAPRAAAEPLAWSVRVGDYTHAGNAFLGGEVVVPLRYGWELAPNVEAVFVSHGHLVTANFDAHVELPVQRPFSAWVGGGPALVFRGNSAAGGNSTDFGFDLLAGAGWRVASVLPYVQAKALLSSTSDFVIAFGLRF